MKSHDFTDVIYIDTLKKLLAYVNAESEKDSAAFSPGRLFDAGLLLDADVTYDAIRKLKVVQNADTFLILMTAMLQQATEKGHGLDDNDVRMLLTLAVVARTFYKMAEKEGKFDESDEQGAFTLAFDLESITNKVNNFAMSHKRLTTTMMPCVNVHNTLDAGLTAAQRVSMLSFAIHSIVQHPDRKQGRADAVEALVVLGAALFGDITDPNVRATIAPPEDAAKYRAQAAEALAKLRGEQSDADIENVFKPQQ